MQIEILEESNLQTVKYFIKETKELFEESCKKVEGELVDFIPYDFLNPIQTVYYKYYYPSYKSTIISTPTSSGKSGIIYLTFYKNFMQSNGKNIGFIYTAPTKALIEEKYQELKQFFLKKNLTVDIKTGDYISKRIDPNTNIICTTYDSLSIALRNKNEWTNKNFIIIDEIHSLVTNLGKFLIEILALSKYYKISIVALSATLPIIEELTSYLKPELILTSKYRPVKLNKTSIFIDSLFLKDVKPLNKEIFKNLNNRFSKLNTEEKCILYTLDLAINRAKFNEKVIIFVWSKSIGWKFLKFAHFLGLNIKNQTLNFELDNSNNQRDLSTLNIAIAFHNADIPLLERQEIEKEFRDDNSELKILIATQTLALGVNLPADTAIINIKSFPAYGNVQILPSILDILQEEGRVGRFGLRNLGNSFRVFWSTPKYLKNSLINLENLPLNYNEYFSNNSFFNILSLLTLSSFNLFGDERLIFDSIIINYINKEEIKSILNYYLKVLEKWGFIENNKLTDKSFICLYSNIPPHFLQGFFEMYKHKDYLKFHYFDIAFFLGIRSVLHTKNFLAYYDTFGYIEWKKHFANYWQMDKNQIKHTEELIKTLLNDYIGLFVSNEKIFERLYISMWEYLAWASGLIIQIFNKPIGEYSTIKNDIHNMVWIIHKILQKNIEADILKRAELCLIYGSDPNYSILGKIKEIGHKRISVVSQKLREININFLENEYQLLELKKEFSNDQEIKNILNIIEKNLNKQIHYSKSS
ncbi:MAG: DEAD/DEAH box helicase [bacterium]